MNIIDRVRTIRAAVRAEVANSGLHDVNEGAADAYRHLLLSAEFRRQFGRASRWGLQVRELWQELVGENTPASAAMDRQNNRVGSLTGSRVDTWQEVIAESRRQMLAAAKQNGSGQNATPTWILKTPVNRWPAGWDKKAPTKHKFGGKQHRFSEAPGQITTESKALARQDEDDLETQRFGESGGGITRPAATTDLLVEPKTLSLENKDRLRDRLGFHAEEAERDPRKREKVAKCMRDCFVEETGFAGLPGKLPDQLGGIAATMSPVAALGILGDAVPEARPQEVPRRRRLAADGTPVRPRRIEPESLDRSGQAAVRQAILRIGPGKVQSQVARAPRKKRSSASRAAT